MGRASRAKRERRDDAPKVNRDLRELQRTVLGDLRAMLKANTPAARDEFPERMCTTCAFVPGTDDDKGWDQTLLNLLCALVERRPFICHDRLPRDHTGDWTVKDVPRAEIDLCAGFLTVVDEAQQHPLIAAIRQDPEARAGLRDLFNSMNRGRA